MTVLAEQMPGRAPAGLAGTMPVYLRLRRAWASSRSFTSTPVSASTVSASGRSRAWIAATLVTKAGARIRSRPSSRASATQIAQLALGVLACFVVPAWSWLDGSGSLAWTMYAHSSSFRLRIQAVDGSGKARFIAPSALAAVAEQDLRTALGGAEGFRHARQGRPLQRYLSRVSELACRVSHATQVALTLEVKDTLDTPVVTTVRRQQCAGGAP